MKRTLTIILLSFATVFTGCETLRNAFQENKETIYAIAKIPALIAANVALNKLESGVAELRPYIPQLRTSIATAFTFSADEASIVIRESVNQLPEEYREQVLLALIEEISSAGDQIVVDVGDGVTASRDDSRVFGNVLLENLTQ